MTRGEQLRVHPIHRAWGSAPGKVILFGEHAVVYGQPAIAVPLSSLKARARAVPGLPDRGIVIHAETIGRHYLMAAAALTEPFSFTCRNVLHWLGVAREPDLDLHVESDIPIASGLGSGAATAAAIAKALARWLGFEFSAAQLSALVYKTERLHHGTPSGIDNTVVAYEMPVWFRRGAELETFAVGCPVHLLVADTGEPSRTRVTVGDVASAWEEAPERYERLFAAVGDIAQQARLALARGAPDEVGALMNENQRLLQEMGVSAPSNERLAEAALAAGALGAKLSGGGRGGNNVALVSPARQAAVAEALYRAGAVRVLATTLT